MKATVIDRTEITLVNGSILLDIFKAGMACGDAVDEMHNCLLQ